MLPQFIFCLNFYLALLGEMPRVPEHLVFGYKGQFFNLLFFLVILCLPNSVLLLSELLPLPKVMQTQVPLSAPQL